MGQRLRRQLGPKGSPLNLQMDARCLLTQAASGMADTAH